MAAGHVRSPGVSSASVGTPRATAVQAGVLHPQTPCAHGSASERLEWQPRAPADDPTQDRSAPAAPGGWGQPGRVCRHGQSGTPFRKRGPPGGGGGGRGRAPGPGGPPVAPPPRGGGRGARWVGYYSWTVGSVLLRMLTRLRAGSLTSIIQGGDRYAVFCTLPASDPSRGLKTSPVTRP